MDDIIEQYKKNKEKPKDNVAPPVIGLTLVQIMQDKKMFYLFGKLLEREGDTDLAKRAAEGKLEQGDIDLLEDKRKIFSEKMIQSEAIEKLLTSDNLMDFARNSPDFEKVVNTLTPEKAAEVIKSQLKEISITDEDRFNTIVSLIKAKEDYKSVEYKETKDKIEKLLKDNGITSKEYLDVLAIEDAGKKAEALARLAKKYGRRWFRGLNQELMDNLQKSEGSLEDSVNRLNLLSGSIGSALFMTVNENESMRNALSNELIGEKAPEGPKNGFKELKKEALSEAEIDAAWKKLKEESGYDEHPEDQERIKDMFIEEQKETYKKNNEKNKGFWARIFEAMFDRMIKEKKAKLK